MNEVLYAAKSHWGYSEKFMQAFMDHFSLDASYIEKNIVKTANFGGAIIGFFSFCVGEGGNAKPHTWELDYFFIDPAYIKKGFGRQMWEHCCETAREHGVFECILWSDPNAEQFYKKMGCTKIGERPSPLMADRKCPILKYVIT
ncbi:MAG: GNAT family N-acetyltransferase [Simkaniaceae bacterium]